MMITALNPVQPPVTYWKKMRTFIEKEAQTQKLVKVMDGLTTCSTAGAHSDKLTKMYQLKQTKLMKLSQEILKLTQMSVGPSPSQRMRNLQISVHTKL